ncbi:unnamed protein product [Amoebophrya sp. A25]|nr:unnamed protein product [Amoebophrya sp. A25]|eukprot:GSA25T00004692001.1
MSAKSPLKRKSRKGNKGSPVGGTSTTSKSPVTNSVSPLEKKPRRGNQKTKRSPGMTAKSKTSTRKTTTSPTTRTLRVNEADLEAYRGRSRTIKKNVNTLRDKLLPGSKVTTARGENGGRVRSCSRRVTCAAVMVVPAALPLEQKRRNTDRTINIVQDDTHQGVQEPSGKVSKTSVRRVRSHLRGSARAYFEKSVEQGSESSFLDVSLTTKCTSCGTQQVDRAPSGKDEKKQVEGAPTESQAGNDGEKAVTSVPEDKTEEASSDVGEGQALEASTASGPAAPGLEASTAAGPAAPGLVASAASETAPQAPGSQNGKLATDTTQDGARKNVDQAARAGQSSSMAAEKPAGKAELSTPFATAVGGGLGSAGDENTRGRSSVDDAKTNSQVGQGNDNAKVQAKNADHPQDTLPQGKGQSVCTQELKDSVFSSKNEQPHGECQGLADALQDLRHHVPSASQEAVIASAKSIEGFSGHPKQLSAEELHTRVTQHFPRVWKYFTRPELFQEKHFGIDVQRALTSAVYEYLWAEFATGSVRLYTKEYPECAVELVRAHLLFGSQLVSGCFKEHPKAHSFVNQSRTFLWTIANALGGESAERVNVARKKMLQLLERAPTEGENNRLDEIVKDAREFLQGVESVAERKRVLRQAEVEWKQLQSNSVWTGPRSGNELEALLHRVEEPLLIHQADHESILKIFKGEEPIVNLSTHLLPSVLHYNPVIGGDRRLRPGILIDAGECSVLAAASYDTASDVLDRGKGKTRRKSHVKKEYETLWPEAVHNSLRDPKPLEAGGLPVYSGIPKVIIVPADQKVADWNSFISEPKTADRLRWRDSNQHEKATLSQPQERFVFLPEDATKEIAVEDLKKIAEHINSWPAWERHGTRTGVFNPMRYHFMQSNNEVIVKKCGASAILGIFVKQGDSATQTALANWLNEDETRKTWSVPTWTYQLEAVVPEHSHDAGKVLQPRPSELPTALQSTHQTTQAPGVGAEVRNVGMEQHGDEKSRVRMFERRDTKSVVDPR